MFKDSAKNDYIASEQLGQALLFFASAGDPNNVVTKLDEALKAGVDINLAVRQNSPWEI